MPGQRKHESGAKNRKLDEIKKERAKELLQKTPKLTNMWRSNQPAVAATTNKDTTVSDGEQPTTASQLTSPTSQSASNSATISEATSDGEEAVGNLELSRTG